MRVARTIADMNLRNETNENDIALALTFRKKK